MSGRAWGVVLEASTGEVFLNLPLAYVGRLGLLGPRRWGGFSLFSWTHVYEIYQHCVDVVGIYHLLEQEVLVKNWIYETPEGETHLRLLDTRRTTL